MGSQCRGKDEPGNQGTAMLRQAGGGGGVKEFWGQVVVTRGGQRRRARSEREWT